MANTLTNLIPQMQAGLDVVSREMVGHISAVRVNTMADRVAKNQSVYVPISADASAADSNPDVTAPDAGDETTGSKEINISKFRHVAIRYNGEETLGLKSGGIFESLLADRTYQAMRTITNEMEADIQLEARLAASRAYGTAGTTPFGTADDFTDFAKIAEILDDNGCPQVDRQFVLSNAAISNLRGKQSSLFKVNEAGSADMRLNGMTDRIEGFAIRQTGQAKTVTSGTGTGYLLNDASAAIGDTTINCDTGTGTILAGDIVTIDGHNYIVETALSSGSFTINAPGLQTAPADNATITVLGDNKPSLAYDRNAIILANRMQAAPEGGDGASDVTMLQDPVSGIVFEIAEYKQFMQNVLIVRTAWGVGHVKNAHIASLLG